LPTGATTMTTGLILAAVVVPMAWTTEVPVIGALLAVGTFLLPANNAGIGAYLSFVTPDEMQGRLNSAAGFVSDGLTPLAPVVAGVYSQRSVALPACSSAPPSLPAASCRCCSSHPYGDSAARPNGPIRSSNRLVSAQKGHSPSNG